MAFRDISYESLPEAIRRNLTRDQFELARTDILEEGEAIPETTEYIDLATGLRKIHSRGELAPSGLLPSHNLSGAHGKSYGQWERTHRF